MCTSLSPTARRVISKGSRGALPDLAAQHFVLKPVDSTIKIFERYYYQSLIKRWPHKKIKL
jgi:hypothetical protein